MPVGLKPRAVLADQTLHFGGVYVGVKTEDVDTIQQPVLGDAIQEDAVVQAKAPPTTGTPAPALSKANPSVFASATY